MARDSQQQPVVLKQFRFSSREASWAGFRAYESEIAVLLSTNGVPETVELGLQVQTAAAPKFPTWLLALITPLSFSAGVVVVLWGQPFVALAFLFPALIGLDASLTATVTSQKNMTFFGFASRSFWGQLLKFPCGLFYGCLLISNLAMDYSHEDKIGLGLVLFFVLLGWIYSAVNAMPPHWPGVILGIILSIPLVIVTLVIAAMSGGGKEPGEFFASLQALLIFIVLPGAGVLEILNNTMKSLLEQSSNAHKLAPLPVWLAMLGFGGGVWAVVLYQAVVYEALDSTIIPDRSHYSPHLARHRHRPPLQPPAPPAAPLSPLLAPSHPRLKLVLTTVAVKLRVCRQSRIRGNQRRQA